MPSFLTLQGLRTKQFGRVRDRIQKVAVVARHDFAAALLDVRGLAGGIGAAQLCTVRAGHLYQLQEFLDLQVRHHTIQTY